MVFARISIFQIDILLTEFSNEHESCDYYAEPKKLFKNCSALCFGVIDEFLSLFFSPPGALKRLHCLEAGVFVK